jgi:hypothetical protein
MSSEKEKKPRKAPAKKAATTGEGAEKKVKAAAKPKATAAAEAKAAPKAKTAAKSAVAAGVPEVAAQIAKPRPTHQQIAELAYSYYIERGWVDGYPEQDWFRAELVLLDR